MGGGQQTWLAQRPRWRARSAVAAGPSRVGRRRRGPCALTKVADRRGAAAAAVAAATVATAGAVAALPPWAQHCDTLGMSCQKRCRHSRVRLPALLKTRLMATHGDLSSAAGGSATVNAEAALSITHCEPVVEHCRGTSRSLPRREDTTGRPDVDASVTRAGRRPCPAAVFLPSLLFLVEPGAL